MKKNYRNIVEQVVVDDTYYIKKYKWTIVDDENKVYESGQTDTLNDALEQGRKRMKKL